MYPLHIYLLTPRSVEEGQKLKVERSLRSNSDAVQEAKLRD